jgi:hypothetical protein
MKSAPSRGLIPRPWTCAGASAVREGVGAPFVSRAAAATNTTAPAASIASGASHSSGRRRGFENSRCFTASRGRASGRKRDTTSASEPPHQSETGPGENERRLTAGVALRAVPAEALTPPAEAQEGRARRRARSRTHAADHGGRRPPRPQRQPRKGGRRRPRPRVRPRAVQRTRAASQRAARQAPRATDARPLERSHAVRRSRGRIVPPSNGAIRRYPRRVRSSP